ncbi:MAG: DUF7689 domain-containing protein [Blastocatellia bacterium]
MPLEDIEQNFPGLKAGEWSITSDEDDDYNCIAYAVHDLRQFWDPSLVGVRGYYWPPGVSRDDSLNGWIRALEMNSYKVCGNGELEPGVEKIAIYVDDSGIPQHVARQLPDGAWTSKLGKGEDIRHASLESLAGDLYGKVTGFMMRKPPKMENS